MKKFERNEIGQTAVERVTAYLDHLDEVNTQGGVTYPDAIHSFGTMEGDYIIKASDLRSILAMIGETVTQYGVSYQEEPNSIRPYNDLELAKSRMGDPENFPNDRLMTRQFAKVTAGPWTEMKEGN